MFKKLIAFFVTILTFFASLFNLGGKVTVDSTDDTDFVPVLRFVVSSDSHVSAAGDERSNRIAKMIKTGYAFAEANENYKKLDAAVLVGDITGNGTKAQFQAAISAVNSALKDGTAFIGVVAKSHDCNTMGREALDYYTACTGLSADTHTVLNGFHFIGLSVSPDESVHYSDAQIAWLDAQLAEAVADAPEKPVFVFQHEHIYNTVYGSYPTDGWGVDYLTETLSKYPNVIDISGHSHYPANDPRAIWQDTFTAINDGGLNYYEFTFDGETSYHPESENNMAQCLLVEADAENTVRVTVYDLMANKAIWYWTIENPADTSSYTYRQDTRSEASTAPVMNGDISVKSSCKTHTFTIAPATPGKDDIVFIYRFTVKNEKGEIVAEDKCIADYYKTLTPSDVSFSTKLDKGIYTVEFTAENAWGKQSKLTKIVTVD